MPPDNDSWDEWRIYILKELKRQAEQNKQVIHKLDEVKTDIATLKVKAGVWGLIGGMIPVVVILGIWLLKTI